MRPVLLTVVEGKNFILGSFDTTNLAAWWKSEPFPGSIEKIESPIHVYGQYHVCIVKKTDGTYSIYRTKNYGKSWVEVYNTPHIIYTLTRIDYGWIIGSTSTGWIESKLDSGLTWTALSSFAPGCKTVINISDDILFAHDGSKVWRSTDNGATWSIVLNKAGWISYKSVTGGPTRSFKWNSIAYPALAGTGETVLVGFGPYLNISFDLGNSWGTHINAWEDTNPGYGSLGGNGRFSPLYNTIILQIILTEYHGPILDQSCFMARTTTSSYSSVRYLYSGINYEYYHSPGRPAGVSTAYAWTERFSLPFANDTKGQICAYNVLRPGSSMYDIMAVVCSTDSNNSPVIKTSTDGGWIWNTLNSSTVTVYEGDPAQEIVSPIGQQVFDEEYWTTATWVGEPCHNSGRYIIDYNKTVRGISADFDFLTSFTKTKSYGSDMTTYITYEDTYDFDILNKVSIYEYVPSDMLLKDTVSIFHSPDILMEKEFPISFDMDILNAARKISELDIDSLVQKTCFPEMYPRMYLIGPNEKSYGMETKIVDNRIDEIMNSVERYTIQLPDIHYPDIPYKPVDFRTDGVTL